MTGYLRRLLTTGAAYQVADAVSKVIALALLPVYTRHLTRADYGTAELLLTTIILVSIIVRAGLGEALVRAAIDRARERGCGRIALDTGERNEAAVALYRSFGFSDEAYEGGRAMLMRLWLDQG